MRYMSELTKKDYATADECIKAEEEYLNEQAKKKEAEARKANERKIAADKVEEARKKYVDAQHAYRKELEDFCAKYKTYHRSLSGDEIPTLFDFFSWL